MKQYLEDLDYILNNGIYSENRTDTNTISVFGMQTRYRVDLNAFPILTSKKINFKSIVKELLWFLKGGTNSKDLEEQGVNIWKPWGLTERQIRDFSNDDKLVERMEGELGPIYGKQWINWNGRKINQLEKLINDLKSNPYSRRHIVTAWNPEVLPKEELDHATNVLYGAQVLPPCHTMFQLHVTKIPRNDRVTYFKMKYSQEGTEEANNLLSKMKKIQYGDDDKEVDILLNYCNIPKHYLSLQLYARSQDYPVGTPYNVTSYSLLLAMIAQCVDMIPLEYIHTSGNAHIYLDQLSPVKQQLKRSPLKLPRLHINPYVKNLFEFTVDDFSLIGYNYHPYINYPVAV